jgi:hypothetical protein
MEIERAREVEEQVRAANSTNDVLVSKQPSPCNSLQHSQSSKHITYLLTDISLDIYTLQLYCEGEEFSAAVKGLRKTWGHKGNMTSTKDIKLKS